MGFFARPGLAIGFGAFFACAELCLHAGDVIALDWLSMPFVDVAAASLLIYGAWRSRTDWVGGRPYQVAGWAFNASLLYSAFSRFLEEWPLPAAGEAWISDRAIGVIAGMMTAVALGGLWGTLRATGDLTRR
jgi:hypothetical protein